jgi:hypothetical protein
MISEIDINDWERLPILPLYSVPNKTYIFVPHLNEALFFDHLDGMYSYCLDVKNEVVHLAGWAEVHPLRKKGDN